jgi:hypothetical protein
MLSFIVLVEMVNIQNKVDKWSDHISAYIDLQKIGCQEFF